MPGMFQKALGYRGLLNGKLRGKALEIGVCVTASSGFLLLGYDQGIMGGIITEPSFLKVFPAMDPKNKSGAIQALVVAIYEIGCLLGAMFIVGFGDKLGRRRSILLGVSIMYIGAIIQAASFGTQLGQLIVGRIVTGVGNGMNTSTIPVWQSEMAPPKIRGFLVLFEGAMITAGIMISYWLNYGFWFVQDYGSFQWRFPIAFQIFFAVLLNIGVLMMPESPRWLLKHGKDDLAREIMSWQYETDTEDQKLNEDIDSIKEDNKEADASNLKWGEIFSNKDRSMNLWRFSAACGAQAMQQLSGINLVTYYSTVVFEDSLMFSPALSRFLTGWLGTEYFLAACLALFIVDRVGRRNLMMWGAAGMAGSLIVIGACLKYGGPQNKKPALVAAVFIFVYDTFFAVGWLGVGWLYPAEVTSLKIRAQANGFSTMTNWIFNYGVVQLAPIMINTIAWKTYMVFMCTNLAAIPIVYFYLPETNGWKLEVLDDIFADAHKQGKNPVFVERHWRKNGWQKRQDSIQPGSESDDTKTEVGEKHIEKKDEELGF